MSLPGVTGTFDVIGAEGPTRSFAAQTAQTLAHGYVFAGPDGVGKRTFADRLAQSLLCITPKPTLLGYCGTCTGCTMIASGTHPDLFVNRGQLRIGDRDSAQGFHESEEMTARDLVRQFSLHAYGGGFRIFIFEDAEFTREAANALLAFFEEPPPRVLLILTSSAPGRLLATIRSRLVEVRFPLLAHEEVETILKRLGHDDPATLARGAEIAQGSVDRALSALTGDAAEARDAAIAWFYEVLAGNSVDDGDWAARDTLEEGLETIKTLVRDWLVVRVAGGASETGVPMLAGDQRRAIAKLPAVAPAALAGVLEQITEAERIARTNVSPHLVAEYVRMALAPCSK